MVFSSLLFLFFFLPLSLFFYWCSARKLKNAVLFFVSLVFYAWGEPVYVFLLLISTVVDYVVGLGLARKQMPAFKRKLLLIASIIVNLGVLGFFKYYAFMAAGFTDFTGIVLPDWDPPLPIGISFYTFQTMSYTIDVYRRKVDAQRNFISFGCYVAMFPQLVAGPIVRYQLIAKELVERKVTSRKFYEGSRLFIIGLSKKVLLANNIGIVWSEVESMAAAGTGMSAATAWLGIIAFSFQIYFDFSGYSDMAIGLGKMLGFTFPKNFDYPYISQSITEFWRRWHMTLGTWFREYVYIPLGGNRVGRWKLVRNIFIVWFLTGLWHGASWNFIWWGLYFGLILWIEKWWTLRWLDRAPRAVRHTYALVLILFGWVLFEMETVQAITEYVLTMFGQGSAAAGGPVWIDNYTLYLLFSYAGVLILCIIASTPAVKQLMRKIETKQPTIVHMLKGISSILLLVCCIAYLVDATFNPFLYFRF